MSSLFLLLMSVLLMTVSSCSKNDSCPNGFTGSNCSQQKNPVQIQVTKVTVTNFPSTRLDGTDWNLTESAGHADIYPTIADSSGNVVFTFRSVYLSNASNANNNIFTLSTPIILSNPLSSYTFTLFNWNSVAADDNMGSITKIIYNSSNNFPTTINLDNGAGLTFQLTVQYVY